MKYLCFKTTDFQKLNPCQGQKKAPEENSPGAFLPVCKGDQALPIIRSSFMLTSVT